MTTWFRRWFPAAGVCATAALIASCGSPSTPQPPATARPGPTTPEQTATPAQIGAPLYTAATMPKLPNPVATAEPVIIPQATIVFDDKIQLAAQVDGLIELVAKQMKEGFEPNKNDPDYSLYTKHPRYPNSTIWYRKLRENDPISVGDILARLDESQVYVQHEATKKSIEANEERIRASSKVVTAAKEVVVRMRDGGTSAVELANAVASQARSEEGVAEAITTRVRLQGERDVSAVRIDQYFVRSTVNGRIFKIVKNAGEFAKAGETILEVQGTTRFRVEGNLDVQDAERVLGKKAIVEPARPIGPQPYVVRHRQEVSSVAVTAHPGRPLVVSGGQDASAFVWDLTATKQQVSLPHPPGVGVKTVAATGVEAARSGLHLVATGTMDGRVRLWDLKEPDPAKLATLAPGECKEQHSAPVMAAAFSPNGKFLATAAARDVFIWDTATRAKRYSLPAQHRDDVTGVQFTPQTTLITTSRDKTIRVWRIGESGANLDRTIDNRAGVIDTLSITSDGSRVLFDQSPGRLDVVSLSDADRRTVGTMLNAGSSMRFGGVALFSKDDNLILTTGGDTDSKGEMQLWEKPPLYNRGSERRRLITPYREEVTCASFSSETDAEKKFVVVGTREGGVYYWILPGEKDMNKSPDGVVVSYTKTDARSTTIRVEVKNTGGSISDLLQDRGTATVIIDPASPRILGAAPWKSPALADAAPTTDPATRPATAVAEPRSTRPVLPVIAPPLLRTPAESKLRGTE